MTRHSPSARFRSSSSRWTGSRTVASATRGEGSVYEVLRDCLRRDEPVALATVVTTIEAAGLGAKLLVRRGAGAVGTLGDPGLDAAASRDSLGALASGLSSLRHYGPHGEIGVHPGLKDRQAA